MTNEIRDPNDDSRHAEDYLDLLALSELSPEEWAEGCIALAPEVFPDENWDEKADQG